MRQQQFETEQARVWAEYRALLDLLEAPRRRGCALLPWERLPPLLRQISGHYALACSRGYSPGLVAQLQQLVRRGYRLLYRSRPHWGQQMRAFLVADFPRAVRRQAGLFWLACVLFFGPMLAMGLACAQDPTLIYSLIDRDQVAEIEAMYDPTSARPGRPTRRQATDDWQMFGFYVLNNIGIAFRTFAVGLLFGLGSLFILIFNGLYIGAVAGHLTRLGLGGPFWSFVSGHSSLELVAIVVAGAAGLLLAQALLAPGRYPRLTALRRNATAALPLILGAMWLLLLAALVEAFWSANTLVGATTKLWVGGLGWLLVAAYLGLAGRGGQRVGDGP